MPVLAPVATLRAPRGMVSAMDHLAAGAGVHLLQSGGSAADAAVGASAVLAVTAPHLCGLGGDLLAVVHPGGRQPPVALNASGRAGSGADAERLRAEGYSKMPAQGDIRAVTVPACVDGWIALHRRFGRLSLAEVLDPARRYATEGFPVSPTLAASLPALAHLPEAAHLLETTSSRTGARLEQPGAARVLEAIRIKGRSGFYGGEPGEALLDIGGGEYEAADLGTPLADWTDALVSEAWNRNVWTVPPNSQGYLTLASAWMASRLDLPTDPDDPAWAHLLVESARQAGYDRIEVLHERADGKALIDPRRLSPRRRAIDPSRAAVLGGSYSSGDTIGLVAVDNDRMGVSLLQSLASAWGSMLALGGSGIFLHNRGVGFNLRAGHPAEYAAGRRPPHTLSPAIVTRPDGTLDAALATMGGDSQPQVLLQILARLLHAGQQPAEALAAARWAFLGPAGAGSTAFTTWAGRGHVRVAVEGHSAPAWAPGLVERGHQIVALSPFDHGFGHAHAIVVSDGMLEGGADPRPGSGAVAGW